MRFTKFLVLLSLWASALALSACGNQAEQAAAPATPTATAPTAPTTNTPTADSQPVVADESEAPPPQVSETGETSEAIEEPGAAKTAPTLKLASVAKPEPKPAPSMFKEGVHYQRLVPTQPTSVSPGQIEVVEFFWYGCPHCFALDPKLESWRSKDKAAYVEFRRVPVIWSDVHQFHARVFYAAEMLGKLDELHPAIFREMHVNGNSLNSMDKVKAFFTGQGVARADFDKAFASLAIENNLQNASLATRRYRVQGVPFFVINGKFTADVTSAGGELQLLQLVNELAARERGATE